MASYVSATAPAVASKRQRRPRVDAENRKRAARACVICRQLKEKCHGGSPCTRCTRLNRQCVFTNVSYAPRTDNSLRGESGVGRALDSWRADAVEEILRQCVGRTALDEQLLISLVRSLQSGQTTRATSLPEKSTEEERGLSGNHADFSIDQVNPTTAVYTGELSHSQFSVDVQNALNRDLSGLNIEKVPNVPPDTDLHRALRLRSNTSTIQNAVNHFPPFAVAVFLFDVFFDYAQTNYFYVDEQLLRHNLGKFFTQPYLFEHQDAASVCTILMVLAVGTQFAHLSSHSANDTAHKTNSLDVNILSADDGVALSFFQAATSLVMDVISIASIESVQAFLLIAMYTLPIDAGGLSYTYIGLAVKIAIRNGMHRKYRTTLDKRNIEIRNRIWWTTYMLEKRVCVLHGRPPSISSSEVDASSPAEFPALQSQGREDNLPNFSAMIELTNFLESARNIVNLMRRSTETRKPSILVLLSQLREDLFNYWQNLNLETECRDLTPSRSLFRSNVHLALIYHLIHVFIGRFLILDAPPTVAQSVAQTDMTRLTNIRDTLVEDCFCSALNIFELCEKLCETTGLARASYTEFTSCWAALLVILAKRTCDSGTQLQKASEQGIRLLKQMSLGLYAATAEKAAIEAMETAFHRLEHSSQITDFSGSLSSAYDSFVDWATLWNDSGEGVRSRLGVASGGILSPIQAFDWDISVDELGLAI